MRNFLFSITDKLLDICSDIQWTNLKYFLTRRAYNLSQQDFFTIRDQLNKGYYLILTKRTTHLTSYLSGIAHFILTGRWGFYSHALMNVEKYKTDEDLVFFSDFKFVEAINAGVKFSHWFEVFDCDAVCILKPRYYTQEEFDSVVASVYDDIGKPYDKRFKWDDGSAMSCVEIARERMVHLPEYADKMRIFEYMIRYERNITPQMFRECPDFEVVMEIKR